MELVAKGLEEKKELLQKLKDDLLSKNASWNSANVPSPTKEDIETQLARLKDQHKQGVEANSIKKLSKLYGGNIKIPHPKEGYLNLVPDLILTDEQKELLNLGLNCHYASRRDPIKKRLELEILLEDLQKLQQKGEVALDNELPAALVSESAIQRGSSYSKIIRKEHIEAAKALRNNENISIRRADKAAIFVILPKEEYLTKMDNILHDETKFKNITRNPTEDIKKEANRIIQRINMASSHKFQKLTGEFSPGYAYGTVKTHKNNNPLRPIISQIPTATYQIAKKLNHILTPYVPNTYSISSPTDFLEILQDNPPAEGTMVASLDVESLFTNVPVDRTIQMILDRVYRSEETPDLDIPEQDLKALLELCTKRSPFICPRGRMYQQIDGVAMGSPLGVLFANFFMGSIEEEVLAAERPSIYCRYIDDIFLKINNIQDLHTLKETMKTASGLNFTYEEAIDGKISFLDVLVSMNPGTFHTSVYVKATNPGLCMNGNSECPQRYKNSTIAAYVRRAITHCSTWAGTHKELDRATQVLINNGYSNKEVEDVCRSVLSKWYNKDTNTQGTTDDTIDIFYKSHFCSAYKEEEKALKNIINRHVRTTDDSKNVKIVVYYKSKKSSSLLIRNQTAPKRKTSFSEDHVIYKYTCPIGECGPQSYIGMTRTSLSRRLTMHLQAGALKEHHTTNHDAPLTREIIERGTEVIDRDRDPRRLIILEAIHILKASPGLNTQRECFSVLPSMKGMHSTRPH